MKNTFVKVGQILFNRSSLIIAMILVLTVVMMFGITKIEVKTSMDMMVSPDDDFYKDTIRYQDEFGGEILLLLLSGDKEQLFNDENLQTMKDIQTEIEGIANIKTVLSPVSFVDILASQIKEQQVEMEAQIKNSLEQAMTEAAKAARENGAKPEQQQQAADQARAIVEQQINEQYGQEIKQLEEIRKTGELSSTNPEFVKFSLFDESGNPHTMAEQVLLENGNSALFAITLTGNLTVAELGEVTTQVEDVLDKHKFDELDITFSGTPAVTKELEDSVTEDMGVMLALSVVLMVMVLALVFPVRWRLLSLPVVLLGMVWTFGIMGFIGIPLSIVTMAILPILIGLGVDFAIQFHNRYEEEITKTQNRKDAVITTVKQMGTAVGIAVVIMSLGFISIIISDAPMIRDFGIMLTIGVFVLYTLCLLLLPVILNVRDKKKIKVASSDKDSLIDGSLHKLAKSIVKRPIIFIIVPIILAIIGFSVEGNLDVESDIEALMPQDAPALVEMNKIRNVVGSTINLQFLVEADDVTAPKVINYMNDLEGDLSSYEHVSQVTGISSVLKTLNQKELPNPEDTQAILDNLPSEMQRLFISEDKKMAVITVTLDNVDPAEQEAVLNEMEGSIIPPNGMEVKAVGSQVLQIKAINNLTGSRHISQLIGLVGILIGLAIAYRSIRQSLLPIVPIVLVLGWSGGILYVTNTPINPLTAVLGALILGIGAEFTILFMERYHEERHRGLEKNEAIIIAMTKVGRAITASGLTVVAGFSTLIFSSFSGISQFGVVTVLDVALCLLSTLIILPAIIVLLDKDKVKDKQVQKS
ncbi:efflux RND transporter permease subunit [Halalkalibacterium ligniniphilum]|uniref:efflux RND transporter permease subunit n=1 Tax=Halalkalibacterium ligniniphilum TaxID=1134413 RepID=UPI00034CD46B|nr:hydrophobe/amphiphile efflux-3 (HAE3) family transporter [Halalkalibacterium ligniniphilum]